MSVAENKKVFSDLVEKLINRKDYSVVDKLVAEDVVSHDPFPGQPSGPEGLVATFKMFHEAFPDLHAETGELIGEGDKVAGRFTVTGTHRGEFMGFKPTGNPIEYAEVIVLRFADGKIVEHRAVADTAGLMSAVGAG